MEFAEKNNLVLNHTSVNHFEHDLALLRQHSPTHRLLKAFDNANQFNKAQLAGDLLYNLLDVCTIDTILTNRQGIPVSISNNPIVTTVTNKVTQIVDSVKKKVHEMNTRK